jgi:predicted CopG family antitoxin
LKYHICRCIYMSSRNVAVQAGVYEALLREKRPGESFTNLFRRLLDQRAGLEEVAASWGRAGAKADQAALRALRGGRRP